MWQILRNPAYSGPAAFGKTRIGPLPARLRPARSGSQQPRWAHGVHNVAPSEWIGVPVLPLIDEALFEAVREQLEQNRRRNRQHARGQRSHPQGRTVCQAVRLCLSRQGHQPKFSQRQTARLCLLSLLWQRRLPFRRAAPRANPQVRTDPLDEAVWW